MLNNWCKIAKVVVLFQPSSAGSERVFSLLNNFWGSTQYKSLHGVMFLSLCLNYNKRDYYQFKFVVAEQCDND